jgi:transposase
VVAAVIIAELGTDMTVFRSAQPAAAWAGVCPGNNESAGTRKRAGIRKGNVHLRTALVEAAVAACRTKATYLRDTFYRYLDGLEKRRITRNLVRRLERLGYDVTLGLKVA